MGSSSDLEVVQRGLMREFRGCLCSVQLEPSGDQGFPGEMPFNNIIKCNGAKFSNPGMVSMAEYDKIYAGARHVSGYFRVLPRVRG